MEAPFGNELYEGYTLASVSPFGVCRDQACIYITYSMKRSGLNNYRKHLIGDERWAGPRRVAERMREHPSSEIPTDRGLKEALRHCQLDHAYRLSATYLLYKIRNLEYTIINKCRLCKGGNSSKEVPWKPQTHSYKLNYLITERKIKLWID